MKSKTYLLLCAFSLLCAVPGYAQGDGHHYGRGHGKGNPHTDKQGPKDKGKDHHDGGDDDGDFDYAALKAKITDVVASLSLGTLTTPDGAPIPISAQGKLYVVLTNAIVSADNPPAVGSMVSSSEQAVVESADANAPSVSRFLLALSASGTGAQAKLATLTRSLSGLTYDPARVPKAVISFNDFVQAASPEFLANPPAEFVAVHAVLQKITAGIAKK